jgi:chromosomal replication initiation ATPase DnaA
MPHDRVDVALGRLEGSLRELGNAVQELRRALADDPGLPPAFTEQTAAERVLVAVARYYDVTVAGLSSPSRRRELTRPRQVAMFLLHVHLGLSYPAIGRLLGRDHSTIVHGVRRVTQEEDVEKLAELLENR